MAPEKCCAAVYEFTSELTPKLALSVEWISLNSKGVLPIHPHLIILDHLVLSLFGKSANKLTPQEVEFGLKEGEEK